MKKLWLLVGLLLSCQASVVPVDPTMYEGPLRRFRNDGRDRLGGDDPLFQFLPVSGAGAPAAMDLCTAVTTDDKAGNWWCLSGAGVSSDADGGVVLSAVGSPATQTRPLCSNGLTCADATAQRTDGVDDAYASGNVASNAGGDVSVCWLGMHDSMANYRSMVSHADNTANDNAYSFYTDATGAATIVVYKTNASSTSVTTAASAITARARHLICFTYDYVTDGTSVLRTYVDGVESGTASTTAVGPMQTASGTTEAVAYRPWSGSNLWLAGATFGAFKTEKVLSAADMTRLSAAVHGTLTGSRGETVTFTRTSAQTCDNGSGAVTVLPSGRPCVAQSGYLSEAAGTNLWTRSEEFASWTPVGTPIITSNSTTSPDGTVTGDTIEDDAAGASEAVYQAPTTTAGQPYTSSVWAKAGTQSAMTMYNDDTVCVKALTSEWVRYTCTDPSASGAAVGTQINVGDENADTGTIIVWGGQFELGAFATSYIRTEGSTATRQPSYATFAKDLSTFGTGASTNYCFGGTWTPPPGATAWSQFGSGISLGGIGSNYASANEAFIYIDAVGGAAGKAILDTRDNGAATKYTYVSSALTFGTRRIIGCNAGGTMTIYVDGAAVSMAAPVGAGTGQITTYPSTHDVANIGTSSPGFIGTGWISRYCLDNHNPPGPCK